MGDRMVIALLALGSSSMQEPAENNAAREVLTSEAPRSERLRAAEELASGSEGDWEWLEDWFRKQDEPELKAAVLRFLVAARPEESRRSLTQSIRIGEPALRVVAIRLCGERRIEDMRRELERKLRDVEDPHLGEVVRALGRIGGKSTFKKLVRAAADWPEMRDAFVDALGHARTGEEFEALERSGLDRDDLALRRTVLAACVPIADRLPEEVLPILREVLFGRDGFEREIVLEQFHEVGSVALRPLVKEWIAGQEELSLRMQRLLLGGFRKSGGFDVADIELLTRWVGGGTPFVREEALLALQEIGGPATLPAHLTALSDESPMVRAIAVEGLLELRAVESLPVMIEAMDSVDESTRIQLGEVLARLTGRRIGTRAWGWRRWWEDRGEDYRLPSAEDAAARLEEIRAARADGNAETLSYHTIPVPAGPVVFVLDTSGSMSQKRIGERTFLQAYSDALLTTLRKIPWGRRFGLVLFNDRVDAWHEELTEASPRRLAEAENFLRYGRDSGATNISDALWRALQYEDVEAIFLLTDGEPNRGSHPEWPGILEMVRRATADRDVVIHTLAAEGANVEQLAKLAELTGGRAVEL